MPALPLFVQSIYHHAAECSNYTPNKPTSM